MMTIQSAIPLAPLTSLRIGGPADRFCVPSQEGELAEAATRAREDDLPVLVIGNGTNLVISDNGWQGLVISTSGLRGAVEWDGAHARCGAGTTIPVLVKQCAERGYAGISKMGGIPGTVGAAMLMNAGAWGQSLGNVIHSVSYTDLATGALCEVSARELAFGYRTSALQGRPVVITAVRCTFAPGDRRQLEQDAAEAMEKRRDAQPLDTRNCGSVFRNPDGLSAGALIDQCGLKGQRIGDVVVSEKHANFIINAGGALARDFMRMVVHIQKTVWENKGVQLVPEVVFAGDFDDSLLFK